MTKSKKSSAIAAYILFISIFITKLAVSYCLAWIFPEGTPQTWSILSVQIVAIAIPTAIFCIIYQIKPSLCPIKAISVIKYALLGISLQLFLPLVNIPLLLLFRDDTTNIVAAQLPIWLCLLTIAIIPAIFEEALMRGAILGTLSKHTPSFRIIETAFMFTLLHGSITQSVGLFILGITLTYFAAIKDNILIPIIIHMSMNAFGILLETMPYSYEMYSSALFGISYRYILAIVGLAIFAIIMLTSLSRKGKFDSRRTNIYTIPLKEES
jgi:membrane protease YdiL (CAAX protease family)